MTSHRKHSPFFRAVAVTAAVAAGAALAAAPAVAAAPGGSPVTAPSNSQVSAHHQRGELISVTRIRALSRQQVAAELTDAGFDPAAAHDGVVLYRLIYRTVDERNRPTTASGLLVLPRGSRARTLTTVFYGHGTQVHRANAPSVTDESWERAAPITYASAGFATVAPDYLGLGLGPGKHPWMHVPSEVTASVDLLRATRAFTARTGRRLGPDVLTTGFSQGASVAMGTARALQEGRAPGFRLSALAPVSGAYDFRRSEIPALLSGRLNEQWSVAYLSYLFVSWDRLHDLYGSPSEVFRAPYDRTVPPLFDGEHPGPKVIEGLPETVDELLTAHAVDLLRHPTRRFAAALRVADATCKGWTPQAPVRLYATRTDEQAAFENTRACQAALAAGGLEVPIEDVGDTDHADSNVRATARIVAWFSSGWGPGRKAQL
jgi:hypothetical protein